MFTLLVLIAIAAALFAIFKVVTRHRPATHVPDSSTTPTTEVTTPSEGVIENPFPITVSDPPTTFVLDTLDLSGADVVEIEQTSFVPDSVPVEAPVAVSETAPAKKPRKPRAPRKPKAE